MITCDRQRFIDCVNGILMENRAGITALGDGCQQQVEAAERGETVWPKVDGRIVSKVVNGVEVANATDNGAASIQLNTIDPAECLRDRPCPCCNHPSDPIRRAWLSRGGAA